MKKCPNCGTKASDEDIFCPECGEKLMSSRKQKSSDNAILIVAIIVLVVAVLVAGFILTQLFKDVKADKNASTVIISDGLPTASTTADPVASQSGANAGQTAAQVTPVPTAAPTPVPTPVPTPTPVPVKVIGANIAVNGSVTGQEVAVPSITCSSELYETGYNHEPIQANDHNLSTDWCEGSVGNGEGEWLQYNFNSATEMDSFVVYPGFWKSTQLFNANNRPASMTISFSDGTECYVAFSDEKLPQVVTLEKTVTANWVRFTVDSVFRGSMYNDCCISEINVYNGSSAAGDVVPTVTINGENFPTALTAGFAYDLTGTVNTNVGVLTEVTCQIISGSTVLQNCTVNPNKATLELAISKINNQMRFGILDTGTYTIRLTATAVNKSNSVNVTLIERSFTVSNGTLAAPTDFAYTGTSSFWGIFCHASKEYDVIVKNAKSLKAQGFDVRIVRTTDWYELNSEPWYSVTAGIYQSRADAEAAYDAVKAVYPTAFIKFSGAKK